MTTVRETGERVAASTRRDEVRRALLLVLILVIVSGTWAAGLRLGMASRITTRHVFYSIPCAISRLYFNAHGYVILGDVADIFLEKHPNVSNETLRQALSIAPRPDRLMLFPADDKGGADFVTLSFLIFGLTLEGLYSTWFLLFAVSIAAFVAVYWKDLPRLAALCVLLLGIYAGFFALPLTTELFSIHNPRSFGVVSLVPVLHLSLAMIDRHRWSAGRLAAAAVQASLIAFSIHVRSTEYWQVLSLMGLAGVLMLRDRTRPAILSLWPAAVAIAAVVSLEVYQRASFDRVYASTHIQHRIFWHNVGLGFALNPVLAEEYALEIDDLPMMQLVRRRLVETNREAEVSEVFRPRGSENYKYYGIAKDYVRYERVAREVVQSIVWNDTAEALKTFAIDKPRVLFRQLAWAMGYGGYSTADLYLTGQASALASDQDRRARGIYLNVFSPLVWAGLVAAILLGGVRHAGEYATLSALAGWMAVASLLPALVAYPIISAIGVSLLTVPFFLLSVFALMVHMLAARVWRSPLAGAATTERGAIEGRVL